ncbi:putative thiol-disulfide oxidoreductase DCC [Tasmannia lanceolata]|uniref:putative thiol-disulfide oxidoreductase DCC n=1 Tax=Tasmannia lanceolata TaxID=3420 RepID=UPI004062FB91
MLLRGSGSHWASTRRAFFSSSYSSFSQSFKASAATVAEEEFLFTNPPSKIVGSTLLQPGVVIYDGVCHLCHNGVKWVIRTDKYRKIKFCCLQSKAAEPYLRLCGLTREDVLRRFLFVEGPGLYHQASTAALKVASHLPLPYSALSALLILPTPVRDAVYDYVAKRRYDWFGKEEDCIVLQEKEMLERFIDRDEMMGRHSNSESF